MKQVCADFPDKRKGGDFVVVCKEGSHKSLYDFTAGATPHEKTVRELRSGRIVTTTYQ